MPLLSSADLGLLVRERRHVVGISQAELARSVGVSRQWIIEIEQGKDRAEFALVLKALYALGLGLEAAVIPVLTA